MIRRRAPAAVDPALLRDIAASDAARWQVLHRTDAGRLYQAEPGDAWVDGGRLLAAHLQPTVRLLLDERLVQLVDDHPTPRLTLSEAGARRLALLTDQRARATRPGDRMPLLWLASVLALALITAVRIAVTVRRAGSR